MSATRSATATIAPGAIHNTTIVERRDPVVAPGHDPVVAAYTDSASARVDRLRACQMGLARLYVQLRRLEEHPDDEDNLVEAGRAISRRVRAIKRLTELELREHRLNGREPDLDLRGPLARKIISLLVDTLVNVTNEMVSADDADEVVSKFKIAIEADTNIPWP